MDAVGDAAFHAQDAGCALWPVGSDKSLLPSSPGKAESTNTQYAVLANFRGVNTFSTSKFKLLT